MNWTKPSVAFGLLFVLAISLDMYGPEATAAYMAIGLMSWFIYKYATRHA